MIWLKLRIKVHDTVKIDTYLV